MPAANSWGPDERDSLMNRVLLRSSSFIRAARKLIKRQRENAAEIEVALELLAADAFDPRLRTHKLSGELAGSWAIFGSCSPLSSMKKLKRSFWKRLERMTKSTDRTFASPLLTGCAQSGVSRLRLPERLGRPGPRAIRRRPGMRRHVASGRR